MKRIVMLLAMVLLVPNIWSQENKEAKDKEDRNFRIPLIGETAPSFVAESTQGTLMFPGDFGRKWKILFSHPQDFTPVCSSEILELAYLQKEFDRLGAQLVVLSTDPIDMHRQWKKALEQIEYKGREPVKIRFPIVDDESIQVSKMYGMIHATSNTTRDVRGVYIIDPDDIIRAIYFYPENIGRSTYELLRAVSALQTADKYAVLTPADWREGNDVFLPYPERFDKYPAKISTAGEDGMTDADVYQLAWFMLFRKFHP